MGKVEKTVKSIEYDYYERNKLIEMLCEKYRFIKKSVIGKLFG